MNSYAIMGGGSFRRLEHRLNLVRGDKSDLVRLIVVAVSLAYVPILVIGILSRATTGVWPGALREIAPHARSLLVLPLLLLAEFAIDQRAADVGKYLLRSGLVHARRVEALRSVIDRTVALRDSRVVEFVLFFACAASVLASPTFTRSTERDVLWCLQPGTLLLRFLFFRLLWRWVVWGIYLRRLMRLPLICRLSHPDQVAGLSPLAAPSVPFGLVTMAVSLTAAAGWADGMRFERLVPSQQVGTIVAFAIVSLLVDAAPLLVLTGRLRRLRWHGVQALGAFANRYSEAFERRWICASGEEALGTADIQSLNDLGGVFERVHELRLLVAPHGMLRSQFIAVTLPLVPLFFAEFGVKEILTRLMKALV